MDLQRGRSKTFQTINEKCKSVQSKYERDEAQIRENVLHRNHFKGASRISWIEKLIQNELISNATF